MKYAPQTVFTDVTGDPTNYWAEICRHWNGSSDLVIVEQDNEIDERVIPSFTECKEDWCVYAYDAKFVKDGRYDYVELNTSLGCTKFSAALQKRFPHPMIAGPQMVWHLIDVRLAKLFDMHNLKPHIHGKIKHHHKYVADEHFTWGSEKVNGKWWITQRDPDGIIRTYKQD